VISQVQLSKRVVLVNSTSAVITRVLRVTVLVWLYQYLLRRISPDQFAVYAVVTALIVFAPLFSSLFTSGVSRYVVEACAVGNTARAREVVSSIFPVIAAWAAALAVCGWWFAAHLDWFVNVKPSDLADAKIMMALLVTDFAVQMSLTPFAAGFAVRQRFLLANAIDLAAELFRLSLLFGLLFGLGPRIVWVVIASVTANTVAGIARTAAALRLLPDVRMSLKLFRWSTARELLSFGIWTSLNHVAGMIHINADIIVLNRLATAADVAVFKLGAEFYNQVDALIITAALAPIRPVLTSLHARRATDQLGETVIRTARYILWFSLLMVIPLIVYRRPLVILYAGSTYLEAANVLGLLMLLYFVMPAGFLLAPLSEAAARTRGFAIANGVIQLLKFCVTIFCVGTLKMGALGCALSTVIVVGICHVLVLTPMTLRLASVKFSRYFHDVLLLGVVPAAAGTFVWLGCERLVQPTSWLTLAGSFFAGAVTYVGAVFWFALSRDEKADIVALLDRATQGMRGSSHIVAKTFGM